MKKFGIVAMVGCGGLLVLSLIAAAIFYGYFNGLQQEAVAQENALNAQYLDNQNYLSAYISGFYEMVGVANLKSDKMDAILSDAVKGRYEKNGGFAPNGALFSAIKEAYPNLSGLNVYDKIADYVSAKREGYRATQSKLLDMLRSYDSWRQSGIIRSLLLKNVLRIPSETRLIARIGKQMWKGQAALDKMYEIVLTESTAKAYETGKMAPMSAKDVK